MKVLIASSATGGHIYPALAIAEEMKGRVPVAEFLFVGAKWEVSKDIVRAAGYRQAFIDARGFHGRNPIKNIGTLAALVRMSKEIGKILREFKPDICIGTGGHVSGPVVRAAKKAGVRTVLQEQNVLPGVANKLAERYADTIFVGFEDTVGRFKRPEKGIVSGNPVRAMIERPEVCRPGMRQKYGVPDGAFCVLVFGGSQGADAINKAAVNAIRSIGGRKGYFFILIAGRDYYEETAQAIYEATQGDGSYVSMTQGDGSSVSGHEDEAKATQGDGSYVSGQEKRAVCFEYAEAIHELYAAADLIVSRAGALTVTEIAHSGRASILIPSPNVTNNHQYYNAKTLADAGAAVLLTEDELSMDICNNRNNNGSGNDKDKNNEGDNYYKGSRLLSEIESLARNPDIALGMGRAAAGLAKKEAAKVIVDEILGKQA